jgi:hypothetical protein
MENDPFVHLFISGVKMEEADAAIREARRERQVFMMKIRKTD